CQSIFPMVRFGTFPSFIFFSRFKNAVMMSDYSSFAFGQGVCKPITLTCEGDDMSVVHQPIHDSCSKAFVAKYRIPLPKLQVGCHNYTSLLVTLGNQAEQELGSVLMEWDKSQFIQND